MTFQDYALPYGALFAVAFALTLIIEPFLIALSTRWGITDEPNSRTVHSGAVAGAGGLVFYPALLVGLLATFVFWDSALWRDRYLGLAIAASLIGVTGVWDDIRGMKALPKLLCQLSAGAVMYRFGYRLDTISLPFLPGAYDLGPLDLFITILGIAAIINCINMIDGLDGLVAGSCFIMCGFLMFSRIIQGGPDSAAVLVITMGVSLAFYLVGLAGKRNGNGGE